VSRQRVEMIEREMDREGLRQIYYQLIKDGNSPNMAAMLASQQPPVSKNTDSDFCRRENKRMASMGDDDIADIVKIARRAGINTHGKTYNGQLGKYGDPGAWVSCTSDVKETAIRKGMSIDGMVKVDASRGPVKKKRIAKDILDRLETNARSSNRKLDEKCRKDDNARRQLRDKLTKKHTKKRD